MKLKNRLNEIMKNETLLCLECMKPMDKNGKYCTKCAHEKSNYNKRKYVHNLLAKSICPQCREPLDRIGSRCSKCLIKHRVNDKKIKERRKQNKE